ncbi:MAG TPA: COX15/CtaA family protein [Burkholderiaceae bacterium]|nr:COX15/CtaA family protein [Burkholderiaceae bacterium]
MSIPSWIQIVLTVLIVAMLPLATVWVSSDANKYRKLIWVTLFLTFDLVMFGGFTRLTDSGLGCPDWPGCYGQANPLQAHAAISAAQTAMPTGPVTNSKAWIEMIHRYLASAVGALIFAQMLIAWRRWLQSAKSARRFTPAIPTALFALVCLQGAFGAWTVTLKLQPIIVTTHLLLGLSLLGGLAWLAAQQSDAVPLIDRASALRKPALFALILLAIQIALGGWVSTNYATLACIDFPMCQGSWLPHMDFANGYTLWRDLGKTGGGEFLPFAALTAIHFVHRTFAFVVLACAGWLGYRALQVDGMQQLGRWLLAALALQLLTGVSTIYLSWPLLLAVAHNGGAALLVVLLVMVNYRTRHPVVTDSNPQVMRPIPTA